MKHWEPLRRIPLNDEDSYGIVDYCLYSGDDCSDVCVICPCERNQKYWISAADLASGVSLCEKGN